MSVKVGILICARIEEVAAVYEDYRAFMRPCWARASTASPISLWTVKCRLRSTSRTAGWSPAPATALTRTTPGSRRSKISARGLCGRRTAGGTVLHQILAQALGGRVEKFDGGWSIGPTEYAFADGHRETVVAFHQDQITAKPEAAAVIASTDFCAFAGLAYPGPTISFQPHPEFTPAFIGDLLEAYQDRLDPAVVTDASARLSTPLSQGGMIGQIRDVLRGGEAMNVAAAVAEVPAGAEAG